MLDKTDRGEFYREENKQNPNGPDYSGPINVGGKLYRLAGWIRTSKKTGKKFLSLKIEPKNGAPKKADFDDPLDF